MNNPPAFQFYAADWLADERVQAMSLEAEGIYIRLLCYCWREGSIPADRLAIAKLCKGYDGQAIDEVLPCFIKDKKNSGRLINKRLILEREKQLKYHKSLKIGGIKGAEIRWAGHKPSHKPGHKPGHLSSSSSSSSSSNINISRDIFVVIQKKWNEFAEKKGLPILLSIKLGSVREKNLKERMKDPTWDFDKLIEQISNSPFLLGQNKEGFRVFFDWIIKPNNYQKIIEGNYISQESVPTKDDWAERREREEAEKAKSEDEEIPF